MLLPVRRLLLHAGEILTEREGLGLILCAWEHVVLLLVVPGVELTVVLLII